MNPPELAHFCDLTVMVGAPLEAGAVQGLGRQGARRIIPIVGGCVHGRIAGEVLAGGADFQLILSNKTGDTVAELDARYIVRLTDGSRIFIHNQALRRGSADDMARLARGEAVPPERVYFRCVPRFEVESAAHAWLTRSVFVGSGARFPDRVELSFFEVL
jgi:hypothetical protein